jgi:hypothetical protein
MSIRFLLTAGLTLLLLCGCRTDPHVQVYIDNINAEKRLLEDTLFDLQYDYESNLREMEKLRAELARLKPESASGGSASPAPRSGRKPAPPAGVGGGLFPDVLTPPVVEQGTPADVPPREPDAPADDDEFDLTPPKLDLGIPEGGESALVPPAAEQASRWTPRAARRPPAAAGRVDVAENPDVRRAEDPPAAAHSEAARGGPGTSATGTSGSAASASQARRPEWRPYR